MEEKKGGARPKPETFASLNKHKMHLQRGEELTRPLYSKLGFRPATAEPRREISPSLEGEVKNPQREEEIWLTPLAQLRGR